MTFLAYHFSDLGNPSGELAIAAADTQEAALGLAATVVLKLGWTDGYIATSERPDISSDDANAINSAVAAYFNMGADA